MSAFLSATEAASREENAIKLRARLCPRFEEALK
jgi:hypothetical protein